MDTVKLYFDHIEKEFEELKSDDFDALIVAKTALKRCLSNNSEKGNIGLAVKDIKRAHGSEPEDLVAAIYGHLLEVRDGKRDLKGNLLAMPGCGETLITQMSPSNRLNFVDCGGDGDDGGDDGDGGGGCCADDDDDADDSSGYASTEILMSESKYVGQEMRLSADCMREAIKQIAAALKVKSDTVQDYVLTTIRHQAMQLKLVGDDKVERLLSKKQAVEHIESFCCKTALLLITHSVDKQVDLLSGEQLNEIDSMIDSEKVILALCAMSNTALPDLIEMSSEGRLGVLKKMASEANAALRVRYTVAEPKRRRAKVPVQEQVQEQEPVQALEVPAQEQEQELVQAQQPEVLEALEPVQVLEALEPVQVLEAPAHEQEQEPVQARQPDQVLVQMPELPEQPQPQPQPEPEPAPMPKPTPEPAPARLAQQLELFAVEVAEAAIARARKRAKRTTAPAPAPGWAQEQLALDLCSTELADAAIAQAKATATAELAAVMARARDRVTERIADAELRCKADLTRAPPRRRGKRRGVAMAAH